MSEEKIGEDILGGAPPSRIPPKKRKELEERLKKALEEKKRKEQGEEEDNIKLPKLPIPDDQHELSRLERAEIEQRARLTGISLEEAEKVYVREHLRSKPKRKKKSPLADTVLGFP
jgi:hypothetical protein